jgi:glycosyltransferase involved in cell wall biosynthesis
MQCFAKAVVHLLQDTPLRERLGQAAAYDMRARFAWERLAETVELAYGLTNSSPI